MKFDQAQILAAAEAVFQADQNEGSFDEASPKFQALYVELANAALGSIEGEFYSKEEISAAVQSVNEEYACVKLMGWELALLVNEALAPTLEDGWYLLADDINARPRYIKDGFVYETASDQSFRYGRVGTLDIARENLIRMEVADNG